MTREYDAFVASALAAERAGDAETALEYHQGVPMFRRSAHRVVLAQLVDLSAEMTPWLWARWAAYQCTRVEDAGTSCRESTRSALDYTLRMFYAEQMRHAFDTGADPIRLVSGVQGEDWAYHQICTFELDGLERFLNTLAGGRLADGCALAREWVGARVGGFRVLSTGPDGLVVRDLADGHSVQLLDLGAGLLADADGWLIGRLVPSGTTPALMFDTRPLPVDAQTALQASTGDRRGAWITALETAFAEGRLDRSLLRSEDRELVTDVPSLQLLERGTPPDALASTLRQLAQGRDEIGRAAYRVLRAAAEGSFGTDEHAPYVAAAVVNPHGFAEAGRLLVAPANRAAWERWARLVPEPARGRLTRLAALSAAAAA